MKGKYSVLALTLVLILGLSSAQAQAASTPTYLGKTTWTATITDDTNSNKIGATFTITGGVTKVGDEFYLFQGYVIPNGDGPFVISGSGFLNVNTLEYTLSESQWHTSETWRDSGVMHVSIDKTNQNGAFYDIGHDFDQGTRAWDQRFTAGTLSLSGSPIILNTGSTAPLLPLLLE